MSTSGMSEAVQQVEQKNDYEGQFFIGTVVDNQDPEKAERLRIRIPNLLGTETPDDQLPWARPVKHRNQGPKTGVMSMAVPAIGSKMVVVLQNGDPYHPLYLGGLVTKQDVPELLTTNYPNRYGLIDTKNNQFYVDTQTGDVEFKHHSGTKIHIDPDGAVDILIVKTLDVTVQDKTNVTITGDTTVDITGTTSVSVTGTADVSVTGDLTVTAATISLN